MIVLVYRRGYKLTWDGDLVHVLLVDGGMLTIAEEVRTRGR